MKLSRALSIGLLILLSAFDCFAKCRVLSSTSSSIDVSGDSGGTGGSFPLLKLQFSYTHCGPPQSPESLLYSVTPSQFVDSQNSIDIGSYIVLSGFSPENSSYQLSYIKKIEGRQAIDFRLSFKSGDIREASVSFCKNLPAVQINSKCEKKDAVLDDPTFIPSIAGLGKEPLIKILGFVDKLR